MNEIQSTRLPLERSVGHESHNGRRYDQKHEANGEDGDTQRQHTAVTEEESEGVEHGELPAGKSIFKSKMKLLEYKYSERSPNA